MLKNTLQVLLITLPGLCLAACASNFKGDSYYREDARKVQVIR